MYTTYKAFCSYALQVLITATNTRAYSDSPKALGALILLLDAANFVPPAQFERMFQAWERAGDGRSQKVGNALKRITKYAAIVTNP
jgi:hypothetical protein